MDCEWSIHPLGELSINLDTRRIPVKESERTSGPYPYYGASGIVDYIDKFIFHGEHLLVAEDGENLKSRKLPIAFMAEGYFWVNNHAHIIIGNENADTRFLCYAIQIANIEATSLDQPCLS
jgi:type I restriction enzyme S subunit